MIITTVVPFQVERKHGRVLKIGNRAGNPLSAPGYMVRYLSNYLYRIAQKIKSVAKIIARCDKQKDKLSEKLKNPPARTMKHGREEATRMMAAASAAATITTENGDSINNNSDAAFADGAQHWLSLPECVKQAYADRGHIAAVTKHEARIETLQRRLKLSELELASTRNTDNTALTTLKSLVSEWFGKNRPGSSSFVSLSDVSSDIRMATEVVCRENGERHEIMAWVYCAARIVQDVVNVSFAFSHFRCPSEVRGKKKKTRATMGENILQKLKIPEDKKQNFRDQCHKFLVAEVPPLGSCSISSDSEMLLVVSCSGGTAIGARFLKLFQRHVDNGTDFPSWEMGIPLDLVPSDFVSSESRSFSGQPLTLWTGEIQRVEEGGMGGVMGGAVMGAEGEGGVDGLGAVGQGAR